MEAVEYQAGRIAKRLNRAAVYKVTNGLEEPIKTYRG